VGCKKKDSIYFLRAVCSVNLSLVWKLFCLDVNCWDTDSYTDSYC
jgi:hypothetical protein